jgi:tetratricopeptide (TPR) repeat protein
MIPSRMIPLSASPRRTNRRRSALAGVIVGSLLALPVGAVSAAPLAQPPTAVDVLVVDLGSPEYAVRESAALQLLALGATATDALLTAAETSRDLEVALRARWIVEMLPTTLDDPDDPPVVAKLVDRLDDGSVPERARVLLRLLRLDDDAGIEAVARCARLDRSTPLARFAARLLVREWLPNDPFWPILRPRIAAGVANSGRPAARFLRALVAFSEAADQAARQASCEEAAAALALLEGFDGRDAAPSETAEESLDGEPPITDAAGADVVRDFRRCLCAMQVEAGLEDAALAQAARLLAIAPGEVSGAEQSAVNDAALAEDLVWLTERGLPEAVRLLEHRWPDLQIDQPLTAYAAALALDAVGEQERAAALVESARDALRGPRVGFTARIRAALRLVRWGAVDRAVRAYESLLADPTLPAEEFAWASILFAEFLHDQGRSDRAADILQTVVTGRPGRPGEEPERVLPRLDRDPQTVASRMLYFRSCAAADRGAPDERRRLLEESLQAHPRDVDALIALYHLPDATPQQKGFVQTLVGKALARIDEEIQALPDDPNGYNEYAWLVANTEGDVAKAVRYSRRSLESSFDSPSYLDTLAHCHAAAGDFPRAVRTQSLAHRFEPHNRTIQRNLRRFRMQAGLP